MCNAMNPGWAFTFLALVYVMFWIMRDGMKWRQEGEEKKRLKREKEEAES
jgi:hypothetical protein